MLLYELTNNGRRESGSELARMLVKSYKQVTSYPYFAYIINPALMPELPRPAKARPAMRALDVGAVAQISDPTSKMAIAAMKTTLGG